MTPEEEQSFRQAARDALAESNEVCLVHALELGEPDAVPIPDFSVIRFPTHRVVGISIPAGWQEIEDMEARLHGILREESKALVGEALD